MKPVIVGGEYIRVDIVSDEEEPELEHRAAVYLNAEGRIVIDEEFAENRRWHLLGHEIGHAVANHIGFPKLLAAKFKLSEKRADEVEEFFCEHFLPAYLDTLTRNGWLKPPRVQ